MEELLGETIYKIVRDEGNNGDSLTFYTLTGKTICMHHDQDCCENVCIEDITGDLDNLLNSPILRADEKIVNDPPESDGESVTATFYTIATIKGYVDIRWYGESNGYY